VRVLNYNTVYAPMRSPVAPTPFVGTQLGRVPSQGYNVHFASETAVEQPETEWPKAIQKAAEMHGFPLPPMVFPEAKMEALKYQDHYLVAPTTNPELHYWQNRVEDIVKNKYRLDFFPQQFHVVERNRMMLWTARMGFPIRYAHWSFGQSFVHQLMPQKYNMGKLYELVVNTDPCHAYLLNSNSTYEQKLVMAHVYGHNHFFKNNINFRYTPRDMMHRMKQHADLVESLKKQYKVPHDKMERMLEFANSLEWQIDLSCAGPPKPLKPYLVGEDKPIVEVGNDWGRLDTKGLPETVDRSINNPKDLEKQRSEEEARRRKEAERIPEQPTADLLELLIEHSRKMKPWQRDILAMKREESYYFAPQLKTKVLNESFATAIHTRYARDKETLLTDRHHVGMTKMMTAVTAANPATINPYQFSELLHDIERRWDKGQHGPEWEHMTDRHQRAAYDDHTMKGWDKVLEVAHLYNDYDFINTFLTPEMVMKMKLYNWDLKTSDWNPNDPNAGPPILTSRDYHQVKGRILAGLANGGQPLIKGINANYKNKGELLLEHIVSAEDPNPDLKQDYAEQTLHNIAEMWGQAVHLDTVMTAREVVEAHWDGAIGEWVPPKVEETKKPIRMSMVLAEKGGKQIWQLQRHLLYESSSGRGVGSEINARGTYFRENSDKRPEWDMEDWS
jgi:stage V sporulation protein R